MRYDVHGLTIDALQCFRRHDRLRRSLSDHAAGMENSDVIAEAGRHVDVVKDDDDTETSLLRQIAEQ